MRIIHPVQVGDRLVVDEEIPDTVAGRDCVSEVRSGLMTGLSIEFRATAQNIVGGIRRITGAVLSAAALVDSASYQGATVEAREKAAQDIEWDRWLSVRRSYDRPANHDHGSRRRRGRRTTLTRYSAPSLRRLAEQAVSATPPFIRRVCTYYLTRRQPPS